MIKKVSFCLMVMLFFPLMLRSQDTIVQEYKNLAKINTTALVFNNISLEYERILNEHWALLAGAGYRWGGSTPKAFGLGEVIVSSETNGIKGFALTPEVRYYFHLNDCDGAPTGLYAGFYTRFTKYYGSLSLDVWNGSEYYEALVASNLRELGAGFQVGYQLKLGQRVALDLMVAGPRLSRYRLRADLDSDNLEAVVDAIEEEVNQRLETIGMDPVSIHPSTDLEAVFGFRNFRYGICLGFMF